MKIILVITFLLLYNQIAAQQLGFEYQDNIVVKKNGDTLKLAWAGGLSYAQFSEFDYDFDGDLDLFVFDRSSDNISVFTQEVQGANKYYKYQVDAYKKFPTDVINRATLVDYDNDGKKDIFCYGVGGIKVYRNIGNATSGLQWTLAKNLLYSDYWGSSLNLYVSSADIPAIVDVDLDGDLDILTFHIGGEHIQYHKNFSMENLGIPNSLNDFKLMNECWGKVREDVNLNQLFLNDNTGACASGNIPGAESPTNPSPGKPTEMMPKHSGSTLTGLDYNNDGVLDLILGDVSYANMHLLINGGTDVNQNSAMISDEDNFPANSIPINVEVFPAAFILDVDFDGIKDLIVGTNAKNVSQNENSVYFYKNTGTNALPNYVYQTDRFLQSLMIEHGTGAMPVLADVDNDGLKDLFVSNFFTHEMGGLKKSAIAYYKNTGTSTNPVYTFIDEDFENFSQLGFGLRLSPSFGDLNNDGKVDLIIGKENGSLSYFENTSSLPTISFAAPVDNYTDNLGNPISAGQYASPQLFDLNKDGLLDLIVGKKTGELMYYQNIGSATAPSFELMNDSLGYVDVATTTPDGYAAPHFFDLNDTTYLFVGNSEGTIYYYNQIEDHLIEGLSFNLADDHFLDITTGAYSSFFVNDIDQDGKLNLFAGHDLGGLYHFEVNPAITIGLQENNTSIEFTLYPNPSTGIFNIETDSMQELSLTVFDLMGKTILTINSFTKMTQIDVSTSEKGVYLLQIIDENGNSSTKRLVKN
ncbi:MAG: T9SS type A sorting domain-containing protein [Bacteroidota bacterium]